VNHERIAALIEALLVLLDAADLSDADADAVVQVLLPKVQQRSGPVFTRSTLWSTPSYHFAPPARCSDPLGICDCSFLINIARNECSDLPNADLLFLRLHPRVFCLNFEVVP
jgi:hypothetical protein